MRILIIILLIIPSLLFASKILIYMDSNQTDHLKAYGVVYYCLQQGHNVEWLLNYRGGSFLLPALTELENRLRIDGVSYTLVNGTEIAQIYKVIEENNMDRVILEKAAKLAIYIPPHPEMWDDAVVLALDYANVPYATLWDPEILAGELSKYDWLHCHHEDFTGQFGKFYASFGNTAWYKKTVAISKKTARELGFNKVPELKKAVAVKIKEYVADGGFLFGMCSMTDTYDIALSALNLDIVPAVFDGDPPDPNCQEKLNYDATLAFTDFTLEMNPYVYEFSDIDVSPNEVAQSRYFTLFDFSAKYDPVPTMLVQNHTAVVKDFLGQTTGYRKKLIKNTVRIMGEYPEIGVAKYIHGNLGKGTFTFLAGHDPEDYRHLVGDPPTDLNLHKNSAGYRLILNNILFPAAKKKKLKT